MSKIYLRESLDWAATWEAAVELLDGYVEPVAGITPNGRIWVFVWKEVEETFISDIYEIHSDDGGTTWSSPAKIVENVRRQRYSVVFNDPTGRIWVSYIKNIDDEAGTAEIWASYTDTDDNGDTWDSQKMFNIGLE